jgi:hypothetical protein
MFHATLVSICLALCPVAVHAALTDGLAAHYRFDETSGTTAADPIRGVPGNGTLKNSGAAPWVAGKIRGAVDLDGSNDWITTPVAIADAATTMSFSGWVWADSRPSWASIAKNWGGSATGQFHCGLDASTGRLSNYLSDGTSVMDADVFPTGSWQQVAFTYDGAAHRLYRNGKLVATRTTITTLVRSSAVTALGCKTRDDGLAPESGAPGYWNGRHDDFGFWNRALSAVEVAEIYQRGLLGFGIGDPPPPLISGFAANPATIPVGTTTTLSWSVANADTLTLAGGPFSNLDVTGLTGIVTPPLTADVVFTLTATNAAGASHMELPVGVGTVLLEPVINEFLASNFTGLRDATIDGDSEDWIEIRNPNPLYPLDLSGYHLTDDPGKLDKWTFPSATIAPGGYLVVFASEKDRTVADQPLHTNFKLAADGEYLALVKPDGTSIVHEFAPAFPVQTADLSYGPTGYLATPTPGAANSGPAGSLITGVTENPPPPTDADDLTITATITPQGGATVAAATLIYRVMYGAETSVPMTPGAADLYTAVIPASAATPGQMVRWRITAVDSASRASRAPLFPVSTDSPQYYGTVVAEPSVTSQLPVIYRFVENPAGIDNDPGTRCSVFFDGEFFDNLEIRIRGNTSRSWPKKSHKIEMNAGHHFRFKPGVPRVNEFNLNTTYTDKSYVRTVLASDMQRAVGMASPEVFPVQVRQNGSFYSVALFTENLDPDFLQRHGLNSAAGFYKAPGDNTYDTSATFEKKTRLDEPGTADLDALITGLGLTGSALETYLFDQVDIPRMVDYIATTCICQNIDASDKNHYLYRDTNGTGEWTMMPWDLDLTFGPNALNTDTMVYQQNYASHPFIGARPYLLHSGKYNRFLEAVVNTPRCRAMVVRRIRSLTDQFLATHWFQDRIDQLVPLLDPEVTLDHARWGAASHFGGLTHTLAAATGRITAEYLVPRLAWLNAGGTVGIPATQPAAPVIEFGAYDANPAINQDQEFIELRNPNSHATDLSNWTLSGGVSHPLRPGTVIPAGSSLYLTPSAAAFRARTTAPRGGQRLLVQGGLAGHLSNFGETVMLRTAAGAPVATLVIPPQPSDPQRYLAVSELMYRPVPNGDAEFIELMNISPSVTLNLAGVKFTDGINFTFPPGSTLEPLARVLVVKNLTAFESIHGTGKPVAGYFENATSLNNGGERIKLDDATGSTIREFTYDNSAPWPVQADGNGSLVLIAPRSNPDHALPQNWRASTTPAGKPSGDDALHFTGAAAGDDDADGWPNLIEYAIGAVHLIAVTATPDGLALTTPVVPNADDAEVSAEFSTDLRTWVPAELVSATGSVRAFRTPPASATEPRLFMRAVARMRPTVAN